MNGVESVVYEDVVELLEGFWCEWRGINCVYGDLGYNNVV